MKFFGCITVIVFLSLLASPAMAKKDKNKSLPPGLQKNVEQGKPLPPGWQKKLAKGEIMDKEVYQHGQIVVPVDAHGLVTVSIEGKLVRLIEDTREIVEILK